MVRNDRRGVDFGLWKIQIRNICRFLGCTYRKYFKKTGADFQNAERLENVEELDLIIRKFDEKDPAKYDFALFGLGVTKEFKIETQ
jgi:hypothetical protein